MYKRCAFTGHRKLESDFDVNLLDRVILNLIKSGSDTFFCGMAVGFDMEAAEIVARYKKSYALRLIACIPCEAQNKYFSAANKRRYEKLLCAADEKIVFSTEYNSWCMQERDRFMVDNADVLICYLRRKQGGTSYTVSYAKSCGKNIIEL